jgi:N-dimethylarginine dimethylaminohydrolase
MKLMSVVYDRDNRPPAGLVESLNSMPYPQHVLMCHPDYFEVIDVKNPHMSDHVGQTDTSLARTQWEAVRQAYQAAGAKVDTVPATEGCEDMVFTANPVFVGPKADGALICLLSNMKHPSRQREVPAFEKWFSEHDYSIARLPESIGFEGGGDAIWHPGKRLIWGGYGFRTDPAAYDEIAKLFDTPVIRMRLQSDSFYHLDTCFCAIDSETVLINPKAIEPAGVEMIQEQFKNVINVPLDEANDGLACNGTPLGGQHVVTQGGNETVINALREAGFTVHEVETGEFRKSGGSAFCMKMYVF